MRLLHGDLHHYNVLFDAERGWLAIDPKGVVGEVEYEVGAALRNPIERPALFTDPSIIRKRVDCFARTLGLDANRVLSWAFSQDRDGQRVDHVREHGATYVGDQASRAMSTMGALIVRSALDEVGKELS